MSSVGVLRKPAMTGAEPSPHAGLLHGAPVNQRYLARQHGAAKH